MDGHRVANPRPCDCVGGAKLTGYDYDDHHPTNPLSLFWIQTLLNAEQEAQKIVQKARAYRVQRVKDARSEAQKEIEEYRQKKEEEFQRFESEVQLPSDYIIPLYSHIPAAMISNNLWRCKQHSGINAQAEKDAEKEIEGKLKEIDEAGNKSRDKVIQDLIAAVTAVKAEPHINSKTVKK
ncbi:hypothetical protein H072_2813 [Dactylellina haptotyla CBS 200.50]|uniref:V-type proton ATPase subunit G n=1 Tax=Dactylellina haptotyla (strain CBS 200.50) TaxID=1284197 RepID=S8C656_DACHA|nr:hypothetical protein H072_2813 [Dactylellina haptotyla CBS 200.50]